MKANLIAALVFAFGTTTYASAAEYGPPTPATVISTDDVEPARPPTTTTARAFSGPLPDARAERGFLEKIGPRKLAAFTALNAADKITTRRCLRRGTCKEVGPGLSSAFGKNLSDAELVGAFLVGEAIYIGGSVLLDYDSREAQVFQVALIGTHGVVAGLNLRF